MKIILPGFRLICMLFILFYSAACPQQIKLSSDNIIEKKIVIPSSQYEAGWLHELFFGAHWRSLWTAPIEVPVINLKTFAGGITPTKKGGGFQTKSLRFINDKGIQYKFRSIDKDPAKTLPEELQETVAADILKDQISSSNPLAPLLVVPILNAVGILQAEPIVCILPDDEMLGEFRNEFAGLLGMIEIHPDVEEEENVSFAGADKVESTFDLLERFENGNDEFVKSTEYLKARLTDMFLGDWDRHTDQWRWARYEEDGKKFWYPIPRDRDQAFARFDGLFPFIAAQSVTQLEHFSDSYPEIEDLTWSGRHLDRRFLIQLTKAQWDSVTNFVSNKLTDSLIEHSVKRLPENMFELEGDILISDLKSRRDNLKEASECYFKNTMKYVDIRGSNKDEYAEIKRINDNTVEVSLFKRDKETGEKKGEPLFHKIFTDEYTKEIRLLLYDGDDKAVVTGEVNSSIPVYIAGDEGKDELIDSSKVKGYLFGFIPFIPSAETKTFFYDSGKKTEFILSDGTAIRERELPEPKDEFEKYEPQLQTWGHDWRFKPWFGANPDDGLFLGGGPILYEFGFRTTPYVYRMELIGGYATYPGAYRIRYLGEFNSILENQKITLEVKSSGLEVINFFGFGNETQRLETLEDNDYYKVKQQQRYINPKIEFKTSKLSWLSFGYRLLFSDTDMEEQTLIFASRPFGYRNMVLHNFTAEFSFDSRDNVSLPTKGISINTSGSFYTFPQKQYSSFSKIAGNISAYIPLFNLPFSSMAIRARAEKIFGTYPFFESAFIGGLESLRGYSRNRFAGDAALVGNAELRLFLLKFNFIVPVYFGTNFFADAGRVYLKNERSRKWHNSYGGGIWMSFIYPDLLFAFNIAKSPEDTGIYLTSGFAF